MKKLKETKDSRRWFKKDHIRILAFNFILLSTLIMSENF